MADYILDVKSQTNKLDWAMPFQRTGAFPLDRSALFSSLEDAKNYAKGDGSDERALGGTSYIGQVISVLENDEVSAYIITKTRGLMKLAATTSSGDLASDITSLQSKLDTLSDNVNANAANISTLKTAVDKNTAAIEAIGDVDDKISKAVAAADHLSRKIVTSLDEIDPAADGADKYIYMVPSASAEEGDKYDEYLVIEIAGTKVLEKVGDWAVDLSEYATKDSVTALQSEVEKKVAAEDGKRLMTDEEGEKLATIAEGAEKNYISSVADEFSVTEGKLELNEVSISKVKGLDSTLDNYVKSDDSRLLTEDDKAKLNIIELDEDKNGTIKAESVSNLAEWLNNNASNIEGLSENNYDDEAKAKLEALLSIKSVSDELAISAEGQLSVKAIAESKVTGLTTKLQTLSDSVSANTSSINSLTTKLNEHVKNYETLSDKVDEIDDRLTWKDIEG